MKSLSQPTVMLSISNTNVILRKRRFDELETCNRDYETENMNDKESDDKMRIAKKRKIDKAGSLGIHSNVCVCYLFVCMCVQIYLYFMHFIKIFSNFFF